MPSKSRTPRSVKEKDSGCVSEEMFALSWLNTFSTFDTACNDKVDLNYSLMGASALDAPSCWSFEPDTARDVAVEELLCDKNRF